MINLRFEKLSKMTELIDPDKFPIFSLMYISIIFEIEYLMMNSYRFGNTSPKLWKTFKKYLLK